MPIPNSIIIVDPYSTGALYAPEFRRRGLNCFAVKSSDTTPDHFLCDFRRGDFVRSFNAADELVREIAPRTVRAVVAGCETGVSLADQLSAMLKVPGNDPATSRQRRHKDAMQEALKQKGLRHIESHVFRSQFDFEVASEPFENSDYVVKPINSAATDGVRFVKGRAGVREALSQAEWGRRNDLGELNEGFIVQTFISGPEFVVDMVATEGQYLIASVCRYHKIEKNGAKFVYYALSTLNPDDKSLRPLLDYARQAALALDIVLGPIHMELIWSENGPVMIEAGARLHGGIAPSLFSDCYEPDLLSLAVRSYLGAETSATFARMKRFGRIVFLVSERETEFTGLEQDEISCLRGLPSYRGHKILAKAGNHLKKTTDFATCPALVWLAHHDQSVLDRDEAKIRELFGAHFGRLG